LSSSGFSPVGATFGIETPIGDTQPLDGPAAHEVFFDDGCRICGPHIPIPNGIRINNNGRSVLTLIQATRFVDAHSTRQPGSFCKLLELGMQLTLAIAGAGRPWCALWADIMANKDMAFKDGQAVDPPAIRLQPWPPLQRTSNFPHLTAVHPPVSERMIP
jgi:hypothetical protein